MRKKALLKQNKIFLYFGFDYEVIDFVKTLKGRKYHNKNKKYWTCSLCHDNVEDLNKGEFSLGNKLFEWYNKKNEPVIPIKTSLPLYPFQEMALGHIKKFDENCLLALDMGTGKSLTSLAWASYKEDIKKVLIICPASVKLHWKSQIRKWLGRKRIEILYGKTPHKLSNSEFLIINYDIIASWETKLVTQVFDLIIYDEIHYCKSLESKRTQSCLKLSKYAKRQLGLSGTPLTSRPIDLFSILKILKPELYPSKFQFGQLFCHQDDYWAPCGYNYNGAHNIPELYQTLVNSVMYRVKKEDVLKDLPDKIKTVIPLEISNIKEYNFAVENIELWAEENKDNIEEISAMTKIEYLKQIIIKGKMKLAVKWIDDFLLSGEKLVVFTTHRETVSILRKHYEKRCVVWEGGSSPKQKQESKNAFIKKDIPLFIGNIKSAGTGIDGLQEVCSNCAFLEFPWNPSDIEQASDRLHRIGQKDSVNVYFLIAENTLEEYIIDLLDAKLNIITQTIDGKSAKNKNLLKYLMNKINQKRGEVKRNGEHQ